jgi:hypothetical protein
LFDGEKRGRVVGLFTRCDEIYLFQKNIHSKKQTINICGDGTMIKGKL